MTWELILKVGAVAVLVVFVIAAVAALGILVWMVVDEARRSRS